MINVGSISINSNAEEILVEAATANGNVFTGMVIWDMYGYKDYASSTDLSHLLSGTTNTENLSISVSELGINNFLGLYFIEFTSDETENNTQTAVVANLASYYNCLYSNLEKIKIKDCGKTVVNDCGGKSIDEYVYYIAALIQALGEQIKLGDFKKAVKIALKLEESCGGCCNAPKADFITEAYSWGTGTNSGGVENLIVIDSNGDPVNVIITGDTIVVTDLPCLGGTLSIVNSAQELLEQVNLVPGPQSVEISNSLITLEDGDENVLSTLSVPATKPATIVAPNATVTIGDNTWSVLAGGNITLNLLDVEGNPVDYTIQGNNIIMNDLPGEKEWLILPYKANDGFASTLDNLKVEGTILSVNSQNLTNVTVRKNGVVVSPPFLVTETDIITAEFDVALVEGAIVLDMTGSFVFPT